MLTEGGFYLPHNIDGYIIVIPVEDLPSKFFCGKKIKETLNLLGFDIESISYINAGKRDVPCLYSSGKFYELEFAIESYTSVKEMSQATEGLFTVYIYVENAYDCDQRVVMNFAIEVCDRSKLNLSPLVSVNTAANADKDHD